MRDPSQNLDRDSTQTQVYGYQLMTDEERTAYRNKMRNLRTQQEREAFRLEHHQLMRQRAAERGIELPDVPPGRAAGMGSTAKMINQLLCGVHIAAAAEIEAEIDALVDATLASISPIRAIANVVTVGSAGYRKLVTTGGTPSGWVSEVAARPELSLSLQFGPFDGAATHRAVLTRHKVTRWIRHALATDAHILIEKPLCTRIADCLELVRQAEGVPPMPVFLGLLGMVGLILYRVRAFAYLMSHRYGDVPVPHHVPGVPGTLYSQMPMNHLP